MDTIPIRVIRSKRRKKTISGSLSKGELIIRIPARMSKREETLWVEKMKERVVKKRGRNAKSDTYLKERAKQHIRRYFQSDLKLNSIVFSDKQFKRHGSCNTLTGDIRISSKLKSMPEWVLDYLIIHELSHLVYPDHSKEFWELVNQYKYAERARGFLIARDLEGETIV